MPKKLKIGIIGCGAIGTSLAKAVAKDFKKAAELSALYDLDKTKTAALSKSVCGSAKLAAADQASLIRRSDLVIEAASSLCSWKIARKALSGGCDVMIMSAGGIAGRLKALSALAGREKRKVYIPSGAIAGIDALKAANIGRVAKVTLTTRKNPRSLPGDKAIKNDKIIFSGPAEKAVKLFPQNINVSAVLSLAGIGARKTMVKIIASPFTKKNIHEIEIVSDAGRIVTRTENIPHPDNPKTSFLAVLSAIAALRQVLEPVRVGT